MSQPATSSSTFILRYDHFLQFEAIAGADLVSSRFFELSSYFLHSIRKFFRSKKN